MGMELESVLLESNLSVAGLQRVEAAASQPASRLVGGRKSCPSFGEIGKSFLGNGVYGTMSLS